MFARRLAARTLSTIAALTCSTALAAHPLAAQNLITNGSFETGDLTGWSFYDSLCGASNDVSVVSGGLSGTYAASINNHNCPGGISQTFSTIAGHNYTVDFWAKFIGSPAEGSDPATWPGGFAKSVDFALGGSVICSADGQPVGVWIEINCGHVVQSTSSVFAIRGYNVGGSVLIDSVSVVDADAVTTTPEPASVALLGSGLVGLVPMLKRRRIA